MSQRDFGEAALGVGLENFFGSGSGGTEGLVVEIIFVVVLGDGFDLGLDGVLGGGDSGKKRGEDDDESDDDNYDHDGVARAGADASGGATRSDETGALSGGALGVEARAGLLRARLGCAGFGRFGSARGREFASFCVFSVSHTYILAQKCDKINYMSKLFKRTKILATIGPATNSAEKIEEVIMAGVNGCRLNCSHGSNEERDQQIKWIREAAAKKGRSVAIVQDLQGPKIRLGMLLNTELAVHAGDELMMEAREGYEHDGGMTVPVQYNLAEKMKVGEPLSMFDGKVHAEVVEIASDTAVKVKILNDGVIMSKKGINLPDTDLGGDILTPKDLADLEYGAGCDYDYVSLSFVQSAADIERARQVLLAYGSTAKIIAKIETKKAIESDENLEAIVKAVDGIMIARGDMAVEAGAEVVPIVQRKLIALCRANSKLCIVATQMLSSMVESPEPTRAEVSDVATAVVQGADVVMLSDETTMGAYPVEAVKAMKKVILYTQNHSRIAPISHEPRGGYAIYDAISASAARLAEKIQADVIVCQTATGATTMSVAAQRPNVPIISVTANARVANQLALVYANAAFVRPYAEDYGVTLAEELKKSEYLHTKEGEKDLLAVIVSGRKDKTGGTDTIKVRRV